jgi:hypothetical protein
MGFAAARRASRSKTSVNAASRAALTPPCTPRPLFPLLPPPEPPTPFALFAPPPVPVGSRGSADVGDVSAPPLPARIGGTDREDMSAPGAAAATSVVDVDMPPDGLMAEAGVPVAMDATETSVPATGFSVLVTGASALVRAEVAGASVPVAADRTGASALVRVEVAGASVPVAADRTDVAVPLTVLNVSVTGASVPETVDTAGANALMAEDTTGVSVSATATLGVVIGLPVVAGRLSSRSGHYCLFGHHRTASVRCQARPAGEN